MIPKKLPIMAPLATNGDAIAMLEEIKAPQGVVLPPREIKGTSLAPPLHAILC